MGYYVGGYEANKIEYVQNKMKGIEFDWRGTPWFKIPKGKVPIVVVHNRAFMAAGIAYDRDEYNVFTDLGDGRPRRAFLVDKEEVIKECPEVTRDLKW